MWPSPDQRSRSLSFWSSKNCIFYFYLLPVCRAARNWWLIMIVWDQVYSLSEPDFWISPQVVGNVTLKFEKCWYDQNTLGLRILWLWMQVGCNKACTLPWPWPRPRSRSRSGVTWSWHHRIYPQNRSPSFGRGSNDRQTPSWAIFVIFAFRPEYRNVRILRDQCS